MWWFALAWWFADPYALIVDQPGTHYERYSAFTIGRAPLIYAATAPRGAQLVVWATWYVDGAVDPAFCPHVVHRFADPAPVPVRVDFTWQPQPGNLVHGYAISLGQTIDAASLVNPQDPLAAVDIGAGAAPAAPDRDLILYESFTDTHEAGGVSTVEQGIAKHDHTILIRARFLAPRERPLAFDATHCAPDPL